ncbi:FMRFamide receptor [Argonauta hians]
MNNTQEKENSSYEDHCLDLNKALGPFQFYTWGIGSNIIAITGILLNIFAIAVLTQPRMRSSTAIYLISLAVYDNVVLLSMIVNFAIPTINTNEDFNETYSFMYSYLQPIAYPIALIAQTGTIYTTVGFTIERYVAVCRPLQAANICTMNRSKKAVLCIFLGSVMYNVPRMFEFETKTEWDSLYNNTRPTYITTELGNNKIYREVYFIYLNLLVMFLMPFTLLTYLNTCLINAIRTSRKCRMQMSSSAVRENNMTVMLISVVVVFLVCQLPSIADNILWTVLKNNQQSCSVAYIKFTTISNLMVVFNSACNFVLYCLFGKKFRRVFGKLFCARLRRSTVRYQFRPESTTLVSHIRDNTTKLYHIQTHTEMESTSV